MGPEAPLPGKIPGSKTPGHKGLRVLPPYVSNQWAPQDCLWPYFLLQNPLLKKIWERYEDLSSQIIFWKFCIFNGVAVGCHFGSWLATTLVNRYLHSIFHPFFRHQNLTEWLLKSKTYLAKIVCIVLIVCSIVYVKVFRVV